MNTFKRPHQPKQLKTYSISLLQFTSKRLECLVYNCLSSYLTENNFLDPLGRTLGRLCTLGHLLPQAQENAKCGKIAAFSRDWRSKSSDPEIDSSKFRKGWLNLT